LLTHKDGRFISNTAESEYFQNFKFLEFTFFLQILTKFLWRLEDSFLFTKHDQKQAC